MESDSRAPILLVEGDSVDEARTIKAYSETGIKNRLLVARTAENALTLLRACARGLRFRLVLLDMHIPGMGARNLLKRIREDHTIKDVPVVVMSNHHETDEEVEVVAAQADSWVRRPTEHKPLVTLLDRVIRFFLMKDRKEAAEKA